LEFLKKDLEQKEKWIYDLRIELEQKKRLIEELKEEIIQKKETVKALEEQLKGLDEECERVKAMIVERDQQILDLEEQIAALNAAPIAKATPPVEAQVEENYIADQNDEVDQLLAKFLNVNNCPVPIKRLGGGYYLFGTKKIYAKILNGRLVIRVGGGYMVIDEFIQSYAQQELIKINTRRANGEDPFALDEHGSPKRGVQAGSPRSSAKGGSPKAGSPSNASSINGSKNQRTLTASDIEKLKASGAARDY